MLALACLLLPFDVALVLLVGALVGAPEPSLSSSRRRRFSLLPIKSATASYCRFVLRMIFARVDRHLVS